MTQTGTLRGSHYRKINGEQAEGSVLIELLVDKPTIRDEDGNVIWAGDITVPLAGGAFAVELPAGDGLASPAIRPSVFSYRVTEQLKHLNKNKYRSVIVQVPTGGTLDLADVEGGVAATPVLTQPITQTQLQTSLDDFVLDNIGDHQAAAAASQAAAAASAVEASGFADEAEGHADAAEGFKNQASEIALGDADAAMAAAIENPASDTHSALTASLASNVDTLSLRRLADVAAADRARSTGLARVRFDDGTETIENDWADTSDWTGFDGTKMVVSGGVLYSDWDSGEGTPSVYRALPVASGKTVRITAQIQVQGTPASNAALFTGIFVTSDAVPSSASYSNTIGVGVNEKNLPVIFGAYLTGSTDAEQSATPLAAGTYTATITIDANRISLSLVNAARTLDYVKHSPRSNLAGSAVANLRIVNRDSRKTAGNGVGAVFAKTEAATARVRSAVTAEGKSESIYTYPRSGSTDNLRINVPASYDSRTASPLVLMCHGSGRTALTPGNTNTLALINALDAYGYLVAAPDLGLEAWGNDAAIDAATDAYRHVRDRFHVGPVLLLAASMGGLSSLNVLARRTIPGIVGWYGMYPVTNLAYQHANNHNAAINAAYSTDDTGYAAATEGHDPLLRKGWEFRGVPMRMSASYDDTVVTQANNADLFQALVADYAPESGILQGTGAHGDPTQTDIADVAAFFNRCLNLV